MPSVKERPSVRTWSTVEVGENLKHEREALGLTQSELAEFVGASRITIARWETGARKIPIAALTRLAAALGVRTERLLGESPAQLVAS